MRESDHRLAEAKATPIADVAARLELSNLRRAGVELVGPCPQCGGRDRFGINTHTGLFQCRKDCGQHAKGDQVALVQHCLGIDFRAALDWLCGPAQGLSDAERAERQRKAEKAKADAATIAARERESSIRRARDIWFAARPAEGTVVRDYLTRRGIIADRLDKIPQTIRFEPDARYMVPLDGPRREYRTLHMGPAMVAAVVDGSGRVTAVHRTWLDLSQPKGKLVLPDPRKDGEFLPSKKVLGSKKGAAIRLWAPRDSTTMVMAEGIETTLSAMISDPLPRPIAYWCGVDLGNMAGRRKLTGKGMKYAGIPDMDDTDAWVPPVWVKHLIFVQDGDSDPKLTRAKLEAGLRRAMVRNPGLRAQIVHAGEGRDLNDILMVTE